MFTEYSGTLSFSVGYNVSITTFTNNWILDFGVIDHMTPFLEFFSTYLSYPSKKKKKKIFTTDGNMIIVAI